MRTSDYYGDPPLPMLTPPNHNEHPAAYGRRIRDIPDADRPQERLERNGPGSLSDKELLAMVLRSGQKGLDVLTIAQSIIDKAGSLRALVNWSLDDFRAIKGVGHVKALQLQVIVEIHRRCLAESLNVDPTLDGPLPVFNLLTPHTIGLKVEKFWVLCLNRKNRLIRRVEVSSGTATASLVHPREVFCEAIATKAAAVIVAHNHPSGDPCPSRADIQVTRQLREAAKIIGIDLLDHVIIGQKGNDPHKLGYYSFNDAGLL